MKLHKCFKRAFQKHVPKEEKASDDEYVASAKWDPLVPFVHSKGKQQESGSSKQGGKRAAHSRARESLMAEAMVCHRPYTYCLLVIPKPEPGYMHDFTLEF